jgi:hypothetical protein
VTKKEAPTQWPAGERGRVRLMDFSTREEKSTTADGFLPRGEKSNQRTSQQAPGVAPGEDTHDTGESVTAMHREGLGLNVGKKDYIQTP